VCSCAGEARLRLSEEKREGEPTGERDEAMRELRDFLEVSWYFPSSIQLHVCSQVTAGFPSFPQITHA
jgi:hypothetical protein